MSIRRSSKKDPIGTAVFYPNSLPPPPRRSSRRTIGSPSSPTPAPLIRDSPPIPPRASSLQALGATIPSSTPYDNASEYPFPLKSPSERGTPSQLSHMLENLNVFTPSPTSTRRELPGLYAPDSAADFSIQSPDELSFSDLIDEAYIQDDSNPAPLLSSTPLKSSSRIDSPAPRVGLFSNDPLPRANPPRPSAGFYLGSPQNLPPSPLARPIPFRQLSWTATGGARRASVPNVSVRIAGGSFASPLYIPPSPLRQILRPASPPLVPPIFSPLPTQPSQHDLFSPAYNFTPSLRPTSEYTFAPISALDKTLDLQFSDVFAAQPQATHQHELTRVSVHDPDRSEIAAQHLQDHDLNMDFIRRYQIRDELGSGGSGFVCSAIQAGYHNVPGVEVAVKFIFKDRINDCDHAMINGEPVESFVLSRCTHPNIIGFYALFEDPIFWYLVQELHGDPWAPGHTLEPRPHLPAAASVPGIPVLDLNPPLASPGSVFSMSPASDWSGFSTNNGTKRPNMARRASYDLFEAVENQRFSEDQARTIFRQIVSAVSYLHGKGIYHRDLKDENIVIDRNLHVRIIDFGSAVFENPLLPPIVHDNFRGTMSYAAAEVLNGQSYHAGPADVWALGIILGIVLTGESPFPSAPYAQIGRIKMKRHISADAYDLLTRCVRTNPMKRATIQVIETHKWLRDPMVHRGSV